MIGVEPMPYSGIPNMEKGWAVVKESGCDNAKLIMDTWHWVRANQPIDLEVIKDIPADKIVSIQINDVKIGKGAVGIGGDQTGIYPMDSPGGWRLIGGTPVDLYDPHREDPVLFKAGEYIRFVPISIMDYYDIRQEILKGTYSLDVIQE